MLTLQMSKSRKYLFIDCHPRYASRIRSLPYPVEFSYEQKRWISSPENLEAIEKEFKGELYYKTPKWFMHGLSEEPEKELNFFRDRAKIAKYKVPAYNYQVEGAQFMIDRIKELGFCLNSDGVGSGKSFQALMTVGHFMKTKEAKHILLICKKSIKKQWEREIEKFTDWDVDVFVTGDTKKKRVEAYENARESEKAILIVNYHNFLNDFAHINSCPWDIVILDEAHSVKKHNTKMNSLIGYTMRGKRCIFLTATPILSTPEDLFGIVNMASLTYFGSFKEFEKKYLVIEFGKFGRQIVGARNLDELSDKVSAFMIKRSEKDIAVELPDVQEEPVRVQMDPVQENLSRHISEQLDDIEKGIETLMEKDPSLSAETKEKIESINEKRKMYVAARQFTADDPRIILDMEDGYVSRPMKKLIPKGYEGSVKTETLIDTVESIVSSDEKVIIFCHYSTPARYLKEQIEKNLGINCGIYTGDEDTDEREAVIHDFCKTSDINVLIGTDSMAEGLNLQVAKYQIHYEQAETFAMRSQRIGRSRRIGSEHSRVIIYDIITEDSFDEARINKLAKDKRVTDAVVG